MSALRGALASGDPVDALLSLPGVAEAVADARAAVDGLLWDRSVSARQSEVVSESLLRGAWASAWFDGAECGLSEFRSGAALDDSPVGRVLANSLALHSDLPTMVGLIGSSPGQALARMHALAGRGFQPSDELGRPRIDLQVDDPLRLGPPPPPDEASARLVGVSRILVGSQAPGVLVAAVVHAELATARPFGWGSGLVARAALRLVLAQRGVDPSMLGAPEMGLRARGRPTYVRALRGYASGTPDGIVQMVQLVGSAVAAGAAEPPGWVSD